MKRTEIFYYLYIPNDARSSQWIWFLDEQLKLIRNSRLHDFAKINLLISGPLHFFSLDGTCLFMKNDSIEKEAIPLYEKIQEYVRFRYPFVSSFFFRDVSEPNLFEGFPLTIIYNLCKNEDVNVLYSHSKGMTRSQPSVFNWREILNQKLISEWKKCVNYLNEYDVVAMADSAMSNSIVSGNFFWSKSSYIRTLSEPLDIDLYINSELKEEIKKTPYSQRYAYEYWIRSNNPKITWTNNTNTSHYDSYYFLENEEICLKQ